MTIQQHLIDTILSEKPSQVIASGFDRQGINIYRRNLLANAQRALKITFPTVFSLLDSDVSAKLVRHFLKYSPPSKGDWAQWGASLSDYLATTELANEYPYLPDCAALDWHVHCALQGKDQVLQQSSLPLLNTVEPENITVELNQNITLIKTQYPIAEIFDAHHHNDKLVRESAMAEAREALLTIPQAQVVMVFRPEFQPKIIKLTQSESEFMLNVKAGASLAKSLDAIKNHNHFSFEQWLLIAIERNLIHYFKEI